MTQQPRYPADEVGAALGAPAATFLGAGAFGDTWHVGSEAVKIICVDGYPAERVAREVAGLQRVSSPYVVRLHRTSLVTLRGVARTALHFEYIPGGDLQAALEAGTLPTAAEAEGLLKGLLTGVKDLHAAESTVHRDIKPSNVALRDGRWDSPVLLDLGLAKSANEQTFTQYPGLVGTTYYMAPEQLKGQRARKAADLFAIGSTVRTAVNGEHAFYDSAKSYTIDDAIRQIESGPIPLVTELAPAVELVLDLLVKPQEYERGSATSSLRRLETQ